MSRLPVYVEVFHWLKHSASLKYLHNLYFIESNIEIKYTSKVRRYISLEKECGRCFIASSTNKYKMLHDMSLQKREIYKSSKCWRILQMNCCMLFYSLIFFQICSWKMHQKNILVHLFRKVFLFHFFFYFSLLLVKLSI